jgi:hypothetical protein
MNNRTFEVSIQFIIDALQARYNNVKELWGGEAASELWEQALSMVEECGIGDNVTSPSIFVDNYLINGEFVSKEDDKQCWLDWEYDDLLEEDDKEFYECEAEYIEQKWQEYVTNNACLYNDNYACLSF